MTAVDVMPGQMKHSRKGAPMSTDTVPGWPRVEAVARQDGTGEVIIDGTPIPIVTASLDEAVTTIIGVVADIAVKVDRPVWMAATGPDGDWSLFVHPDGSVEAPEPPAADPGRGDHVGMSQLPTTELSMAPASQLPFEYPVPFFDPGPELVEEVAAPFARHAEPPAAIFERPTTRRELRKSFLTEEQLEEPAAAGARGLLARVGVRVSPSRAERSERADALAVSQHWPGPRTIAIVNGKGGSNKTPTTILLAAVFARNGGAGVLTWDNNQTRGTLGWRTDKGPHDATLLEFLSQTDRLLGTGAQSADLARYVHHQTRDKFDVLRSKPMALAHEQRVEPADVDAIHAVAAKYYRLIIIDSGNDESDPMWLRMIDHTDQLVVATTTRDDHAEAGALLLEALAERDERSAALARESVVIVSQADPKAGTRDVERVARGYQPLAREAVMIPFDPAMVDGVLRYGSLRPAAQRAWLAAGAAVARGL